MSFDTVPPPAHPAITHDLVATLLRDQHPEFAGLPLGERFDGWDAAMFRLGDGLAARLPRTAEAVTFLVAETTWLPRVSGDWDFPFPRFVAKGKPGGDFPWVWAVVTWVSGDTALEAPLRADQGAAVGGALAQVHTIPPADAPYNPEQSIPMVARSAKVLERVAALAAQPGPDGQLLDAEVCASVWEAALAAAPPADMVWSHADFHGANVLSDGGAFAGIVDWGSMAACDRAVDLGFAHLLMPAEGVQAMLAEYDAATGAVDDALRARARGVALAKSVGVALNPRPITRDMGWRGLQAVGVVGS